MPYTQVFFPNQPPANRLTSSFGAFSSMDQVKVSTSSPAATLVPLLTRTLRCARRLGVITPQKMNKHDIERGSRIDGIDFYVDIMILYIIYVYIIPGLHRISILCIHIICIICIYYIYICICVCYRLFYGFQGGPDCVMHHEKHDLSKNTSIANYIR